MIYPFDKELVVAAENVSCIEGEAFLDVYEELEEDPSSDDIEERLRLARITFVDYLISVDAIDSENRDDYLTDRDEGEGILDGEINNAIAMANKPVGEDEYETIYGDSDVAV